ncbi:PIN domain-containing protein [Priestia aryabhattai]|uniref:PIN domain-containing protein n=1 Tax=Priestia aryabhattai TaxID=412384 RepID=UPI001876052A|nr:hypothetical protein [Priestia aryabhattai]MBE5102223.1 hypothetical protein [Priestia aryabhattai]
MSSVIGAIATKIAATVISGEVNKQKIKWTEKTKIKEIRTLISDFNRKFDNTELDTLAFQKFLFTTEEINEIYNTIFSPHTVNTKIIQAFKREISQKAIDHVNTIYEQSSRNKIHDESLFYEYFNDLIDVLIDVRNKLLPWKESVQVGMVVQEIHEKHDETQKVLIEQFDKHREDNVFAEDKINEIKNMINLFKINEAERELSEVLELQHLLSIPQREELYYQRARIYINTSNYEKLDRVKSRIKNINADSKFILEIDHHIACRNKDRILFNKLMSSFREYRYSDSKLLLKEVQFEMQNDNFSRAMELLAIDGEIKTELKEHHESHFYFGYILIQNEEIEKACIEFSKAYEMHNYLIYRYNALIAQYHMYVRSNNNLEGCSKEDSARDLVEQFKKIEYYTEFITDEELKAYYLIIIELMIDLNPKDALQILESIKEPIKQELVIQSLFAEVYFHNKMYSESKEILLKVEHYHPFNTIHLFRIFEHEKDWESIVKRYDSIISEEFRSNAIITILYLKASCKLKGYTAVDKNIIPLIEKEADNGLILKEALHLVLENNDNNKFEIIMNIIQKQKNSMSHWELKHVSKLLLDFNENNEVRKLLNERIEFDEKLLQIYFWSFGEFEKFSPAIQVAYEQVRMLYKKGVRFKALLQSKIDIEIVLVNWRKAIESLIEYKALHGMDSYYAYRMVFSKVNKCDYDNLEAEISYLLATENPSFHLLVASLKANQEKWDEAQRIALGALYLSHENLYKEILANYIFLYLANTEKSSQVNFKNAANNTVVVLKKDNRIRNIAIHQNKNIIKETGERKFDCENYYYDDPISLILKSEGYVEDIVELPDGEYKVIEVINLYTYFFRFCSSKIESDYPEHDYFITHSATTTEGLVNQMEETLKIFNKERNNQLEMYNFEVETGIPISYLSGNSIDSYAEMIIGLLNHETQHLYAGEVSLYKNNEYVLSLSSLILLEYFGLLGKLENVLDKCYVSQEVIKSIDLGMIESQKNSKVGFGVLTLNEENQISGYSYNDEDKKAKRRFWSSIRKTLLKLTVNDVDIDDIDIYDFASQFTLDVDIESVELSKKTNRVLVCDDLFIRKIHHSVTCQSNTTNFIGFLISENLITNEELMDITLKLVKAKYLYPISSETILTYCEFITSTSEKSKIEERFEKLKEIYKYIFNEDSALYYKEIHSQFMIEAQKRGVSPLFLYELVREPLKLSPIRELIKEIN